MIGEHVLVGYVRDRAGREALGYGHAVARVTGGRLTVANVYPAGRAGAAAESQTALKQAADVLAEFDVQATAEFVSHESRGVGRGLSTLASRMGADAIVIGSGSGGARGRISLGSTGDHLLHSSPEAVMMVPASYTPLGELRRITVAYVRRPQCEEAVIQAAQAAVRLGIPLRLLTLAVGAVDEGQLRDDLALAVPLAAEVGVASGDIRTELAEGDDEADATGAVGWVEGEMLVCASSEDAGAHRVFLGEMAVKLLRAAPCPVTVLPRGYL